MKPSLHSNDISDLTNQDIILECQRCNQMLPTLVFVAPALHPIIYFAFNSEYRTGLTHAWKNLSCNQTPEQVSKIRHCKVAYSNTSGLVTPF